MIKTTKSVLPLFLCILDVPINVGVYLIEYIEKWSMEGFENDLYFDEWLPI
jgi:hypothetical protein